MNKLTLPVLALAIIGVGGSVYTIANNRANTVHAQTAAVSTQSATDIPEVNDTPDVQEPKQASITSGVTVPESATEMDDTAENSKLTTLAKISEAQAKAAAEKSVGGTASSVKLEEENGNVVYTVTIGDKEVKIDAGNGSVLRTEAADSTETHDQTDKAD